jgi:hypothetical protein
MTIDISIDISINRKHDKVMTIISWNHARELLCHHD